MARFGGYLIGASYIKPNFVGRAAHIANAGYFVLAPYRGTGVGRVAGRALAARGAPPRLRRHDVQPRLRVQPRPRHVPPARLRRGGADPGGRRRRGRRDLLAQPGGHSSRERDRRHGGAARRARRCRPPAPAAQQLLRHRADRGGGRRLRGAGRIAVVPGHRAGVGGPALLRRARLRRQRRPGHRRAVPAALRLFAAPLPVVAAVQGAAIGGGCGLALSADFRVATPTEPVQRQLRPPGLPPRLRADGDAARRRRPPGRGGPPADGAPRRRRGGAGARPVRPPGRRRRPLAAGHRLRRRAGRSGPAGGPRHPGHAAERPGRGGAARHGARMRRADQAARHGRLRRGRARRGRAPRPVVPRRVSSSPPAHELNTPSPGPITPGPSVPSRRHRPASTTSGGSSCWRTRWGAPRWTR